MTYLTEGRDALAKALWVLQATDESLSSEWADRAWDDMGGSEPSEERVDAELLADALIASGAVIDADTLADDEALVETLCHARGYDRYDGDLWREQLAFVKQNLDDLAAALTERSQSHE